MIRKELQKGERKKRKRKGISKVNDEKRRNIKRKK